MSDNDRNGPQGSPDGIRGLFGALIITVAGAIVGQGQPLVVDVMVVVIAVVALILIVAWNPPPRQLIAVAMLAVGVPTVFFLLAGPVKDALEDPSPKPVRVKVGALYALSGPDAAANREVLDGVQFAVDYLNGGDDPVDERADPGSTLQLKAGGNALAPLWGRVLGRDRSDDVSLEGAGSAFSEVGFHEVVVECRDRGDEGAAVGVDDFGGLAVV